MAEKEAEHQELNDDRNPGFWRSRYDFSAWIQIILELLYLIFVLVFCISLLIDVSTSSLSEVAPDYMTSRITGLNFTSDMVKWYALAISGLIGGTVFDLKWLYHSVAKGVWNRDRCLWRLIVPINSAMVSLFTGFLFASGIVPFLRNEPFNDTFTLLGSGFVFGYFSDNILAAMQNLAQKVFGTLGSED